MTISVAGPAHTRSTGILGRLLDETEATGDVLCRCGGGVCFRVVVGAVAAWLAALRRPRQIRRAPAQTRVSSFAWRPG